MKRAIIVILYLIGTIYYCVGQVTDSPTLFLEKLELQEIGYWQNKKIVSLGLLGVAGLSDGMLETIQHHYGTFKAKFPAANDQFWNPQISWKNKYRNWDNGDNRPAFPGSTTIFVATTDAYHALRAIKKNSIMAAVVINVGSPQKWWHYLIDFATHTLMYQAGFYLTYSIIFKQ